MVRHTGLVMAMLMVTAALFSFGCDSGSGNESCNPGMTRYCTCDGGLPGSQVCLYDGSAYTRCVCTGTDGDTDIADFDGACQNGVRVCQRDVVYSCVEGSWRQLMDCGLNGQQCLDGSCRSASDGDTDVADTDEAAACSDGDARCSGDWVEICSANAWSRQQNCVDTGKECLLGQCVDPGTCADGQKKCIGNIVYSCAGGAWQSYQDCGDNDLTCTDGACGCQSGSTRCEGQQVLYCDGSGWSVQENCEATNQQCVSGACLCYQGSTRCNGNLLEVCTETGWTTGMNCTDEGMECIDHQCQPCTSGDYRCNGSVYEQCFREAWEYVSNCAEYGQLCTPDGCVDVGDGDVDADTDTPLVGCPGTTTCEDGSGDGLMLCLQNGAVPSDAVMNCHNGVACTGNSDCYYTDSSYTQSACLFHCGECGAGTCTEGWPEDKPDYYMCLEYGDVPAGAASCDPNSSGSCGGNEACYCTDESCTTGVCLEHCAP